jgi:hypothetical protein
LILLDDAYFNYHRFEKKNGKFIYINTIELPPHSAGKNMKVIEDNKFLFYSIYNFHPDQLINNTTIMIYDAAENKIQNCIHPDLPCIAFSHLPHEWIAINKNRIALSDPCGYKIRFYDFALNIKDSIVYHPSNWKDLTANKIPFETSSAKIHPKLLIDKLLAFEDTISRIEKIEFVNNSRLLVSSTCLNCGENKRRIDIWNMGNYSSPVYTRNALPIEYSDSDNINIDTIPLKLNHASNILFKDNLMYSVNDEDFEINRSMTVKEFNHQKDIFYETHDPYFSIAAYSITTP